ncbi:9516_t:CDS:2, partial [Dentiscutata heterogama]
VCTSPEMVIWLSLCREWCFRLSLLSCVHSLPGLVLRTFLCLFFAGFDALDFLVFALHWVWYFELFCVCSSPGLVLWTFLYLFFTGFGALDFLVLFAGFGDLDFLVFVLRQFGSLPGLVILYSFFARFGFWSFLYLFFTGFGVLDFLVFVLRQELCFGLKCSNKFGDLDFLVFVLHRVLCFGLSCIYSSPGLKWCFGLDCND